MATSGRATKLDPEVLAFIRRANQLLEQGEREATDAAGGHRQHERDETDDGDEYRIHEVIENIVAQVHGHELACACHVFANHTLQRAIARGRDDQLVALANALLSPRNALAALTDKYASHVVEALVAKVLPSLDSVSAAGNDDEDAQEATMASLLADFVDSLLVDNARGLCTAMRDRYATHAIRSIVKVLSGRSPTSSNTSGAPGGPPPRGPSAAAARVEVPAAFDQVLLRLANALLERDDGDDGSHGGGGALQSLAWHTSASPALQCILEALPPSSKQLFAICSRLLAWPHGDDGSDLDSAHESATSGKEGAPPPASTVAHVMEMACDRTGSHVFEAVLRACPPVWRPLYAHVVRGKLVELARHPTGNHAVQVLISAAPNAPSLGNILKELLPSVPELIASRPAVILKMAQESVRQGSGGKDLVKAVRTALAPSSGGGDGKDAGGDAFALAVLALGARQAAGSWDESGAWHGRGGDEGTAAGDAAGSGGGGSAAGGATVGMTGSLLMQALVAQPAGTSDSLIQSAAALSVSDALALSRSPPGSRALEAVLSQGGGAAAARQRLAQTLAKSATRLARDKGGSFLLEAAFKALPIESRGGILESLQPLEASLRASQHGGALLKKLRYDHWRHHPESWQRGEQRERTAKRAFADILADEPLAAGKGHGKAGGKQKHGRDDAKTASRLDVPSVAPVEGSAPAEDALEMDAIFGRKPTHSKPSKPRREPKQEQEKGLPSEAAATGASAAPDSRIAKRQREPFGEGRDASRGEGRGPMPPQHAKDNVSKKKPRKEDGASAGDASSRQGAPPAQGFASSTKMASDRAERIKAMLAAGPTSGANKKGKKFSMA